VRICKCGFPGDEKIAKQIERRYSIPEDSLDREISKWQRRKKLAPAMLAARILLLGLCVFLGAITAWVLLAESNQLTQAVLGVPVVCFLALFYWVFFFGIGRIVLWIARKMGISGRRLGI